MANFIPQLIFGPDDGLVLTFDSPPEGDPQGEELGTEKEQVRSVGGQLFTSEFYDFSNFNLRFILQDDSTAIKLKRLFRDFALKGESFTYLPHSDEPQQAYEVELNSETVRFNRDVSNGQGGFFWSFDFTLMHVQKSAPRVIRTTGVVTPDPAEGPGLVERLELVTNGAEEVLIGWNPPSDTGSSRLREYETRLGPSGPVRSARLGDNIRVQQYFDGLSASTTYTLYVRAVNREGLRGDWSQLAFTTLASEPALSDVRNLRVSDLGSNEFTLDWDPPLHDGGSTIRDYTVQLILPNGVAQTYTTSSTEYSFTGLNANTRYRYQVRANNEAGINGSYTSGAVTTSSVVLGAAGAPQNVELQYSSAQLEDGNVRAQLHMEFDWPTGAHADSITHFKIYTYIKGTSVSEQVRTVHTIPAGSKRDGIVVQTGVRIPATRLRAITYRAYVVAVNAAGDSVRSNVSETTVPRTYERDLFGNTLDDDGNYLFTSDFGDIDPFYVENNYYGIILSNSTRWIGEGSFPTIKRATDSSNKFSITAWTLSLTLPHSRMAVAGNFQEGTSSDIVTRLLLLTRVPRVGYVPAKKINSSGLITGLTAFKSSSITHYIYLKYGDATVRIVNADFTDVTTFEMTHFRSSSQTSFKNVGCCVFQDHLYVVDWVSDKIYCYNLLTRQRVESREIDLPNYMYPYSLWAGDRYFWLLGSGDLQQNKRLRNKLYCIDPVARRRVSAREFLLETSSLAVRERGGRDNMALRFQNNRIITNFLSGGTEIPRAYKL